MRSHLLAAAVALGTALVVGPSTRAMGGHAPAQRGTGSTIVLDNARVRAYRTTADALTGLDHQPAVVVSLENWATAKTAAVWVDDPSALTAPTAAAIKGRIVIVQPRPFDAESGGKAPAAGTKPGDAPFTGMSFNTLFENPRVTAIRARMDVGAKEAFHTHAADTVVVHLSGGDIEDTANGRTVVNHWKPGDVEFEAIGTSHSARNVGGAVDVVLVALKPR